MDLLGSKYILNVHNPTRKKLPIPGRFKGVRNILGTHNTEVTVQYDLLCIDKKYNFSGITVNAPVLHAYMNTRFMPGVQIGADGGMRMKEVENAILNCLRRDFPALVESPNCRL